MKPECAQAIEIAAKKLGLARVPRIDDIDQKIRDNLKQLVIKDRAAYASRSFDENMQLAGDAALQEAIHKAIVKKRNAELTVESRARIRGVMDSMVSTGLSPAKALTNMTLFDAGADGLRPIDSLIKARVAGYTDKLEAMWKFMDDNTFLHLIATKEGQMKILNELYGIDSGDVGAKKAVASLNKLNDEMGADFNRYGGDLHKLVDWRLPQALNQYRLIKMEKPAFIKEWLALVDRNKYVNPDGTPMSDVQMEKFLGEAYQTMISGTKKGVEPGGRGSTAGKYEGHRQLHYKSPEAYMKAMELAGDGNILSQIYGHISVMSRDIQMMKTWGPNADYEFQRMYDNVWRNADPSEHGMLKTLKTAWDMQTGHYDSGMTPKVQHWVQELKASFVASKLGSMVVSQIADTATIAATARAMNVPMSHVMANASKYATDPNYRQSLRAMGVGMEALANSVARHSDSMSASGPMTKIAGVVVQAQGAQAWNNMWRNSFAAAMGNQISHINATFNDIASLQGKDRTIMEAKGVNDRDWGLWKLAERDPNGTMTQRTINEIPLEQVKQFIPEKIAEIQQQGGKNVEQRINDAALSFREDSALKYRAMLIEEAHMAVLEPSLKSKAEMARFGNGSAIVSLLTQFKTFPWAYMRQHMQQRARSATAGSALGYRAQLAAMGTMAGGTALMLGDLAAGRDPRDVTENPIKFGISAFFKGGGIGIFNDLIETVTSEFSRDRAARLLGPAVSLFNDIANVASAGVRGDTDELAKRIYKVTTENTPFQNFWVTRAVVHNVLLHELQELANPGYLDRAKQRAEKNYGAGFWISHDGVRAPDFGNIVGQQGATQ